MKYFVEKQLREHQKDTLKNLAAGKCNILEVGSWVGESTAILAEESKKINGHVTCIDWFRGNVDTRMWIKTDQGKKADFVYNIFLSNMKELDLLDSITVFRGNSFDMHEFVRDDFFDLVYIDADHRYSGASMDIKNYLSKVRIGGIIAGHDFESFEYKEEFVENDYIEKKHHGNIKAVVEAFKGKEIIVNNSIWSVRI